jgi:hypothetical protein
MSYSTPLANHYISDDKNIDFSTTDYSKFKFGSSRAGEKFGLDLFESKLTK